MHFAKAKLARIVLEHFGVVAREHRQHLQPEQIDVGPIAVIGLIDALEKIGHRLLRGDRGRLDLAIGIIGRRAMRDHAGADFVVGSFNCGHFHLPSGDDCGKRATTYVILSLTCQFLR
jgi:hypothetical protein